MSETPYLVVAPVSVPGGSAMWAKSPIDGRWYNQGSTAVAETLDGLVALYGGVQVAVLTSEVIGE